MSNGSETVAPEAIPAILEEAARQAQADEWQAVEDLCSSVLATDPDNELALYLISISNIKNNNNESAIIYLKKSVKLDNNDVNKISILSELLFNTGRQEEAIPYLKRGVELAPTADRLAALGAALADCGRVGEAISAFRDSLALQPKGNIASAGLYPLLRITCDWTEELDRLSAEIDALNEIALVEGRVTPEPPYDNVHRTDDSSANLAVARSWSRALSDAARRLGPINATANPADDGRIRIGYVSGDLHDHAINHLVRGVFNHHDRSRFQVYTYSYGPDDESDYRDAARRASDRFIDLADLDDLAAANRIAADGIDILVDLKSHTRRHRLIMCALRPAPVQVTWLGFPGTTGADFFDYAITDETVTPTENRQYFSENLILMPNTYQPNNDTQYIPKTDSYKSEIFGNSDSFIYCSFNNPLKLDPVFFDIWIEILRRTPGALLWILQNNALVKSNLRQRMSDSGVDPDRLVFADVEPRERHLARMKLADLALDTRLYNGHTTTSDALWAGLPVITMEGRHFASRVSASLLRAANLPELITTTPEEYAERARHLASNPELLGQIRARIAANRHTVPLFDTKGFTRDLEVAYERMWRTHLAGAEPQGFAVAGG